MIFPVEKTPLTIPGCSLLIMADDTREENITQSGNRLSAIKNWANSRTLVNQSTGSAQPGTNVATINGLNAIQFDNDNERFLNTNLGGNMTNATFIGVISKFVSGSQGHIIAGTGALQSIRMATNNINYTCNDGTTIITATGGDTMMSKATLVAITCDAGSSTRNVYKNSTSVNATGAYDGGIGSEFLGTTSSVAGNARGGHNMGEFIVYNRVLISYELFKIFNYLANKWGVALA